MKIVRMIGSIVGCLVAFGVQQASANLITFTIDAPNSGLSASSYSGPYATVDVSLTDTHEATITFTALGSFKFSDPGVNVAGAGSTFTDVGTVGGIGSYSTESGNKEDGFGDFNLVISTGSSASARLTSLSFTITDNSANWASAADVLGGNPTYSVAAHIYPLDGKTGYAANGSPWTEVPDGGITAILLGTALVGLSILKRRFA